MSIAWTRRNYHEHPKRNEEKTGQVFFVVFNVNRQDEEKMSQTSKEKRRGNRTGLLCSFQCQSSGRRENIPNPKRIEEKADFSSL
jgi:hypothetical protein